MSSFVDNLSQIMRDAFVSNCFPVFDKLENHTDISNACAYLCHMYPDKEKYFSAETYDWPKFLTELNHTSLPALLVFFIYSQPQEDAALPAKCRYALENFLSISRTLLEELIDEAQKAVAKRPSSTDWSNDGLAKFMQRVPVEIKDLYGEERLQTITAFFKCYKQYYGWSNEYNILNGILTHCYIHHAAAHVGFTIVNEPVRWYSTGIVKLQAHIVSVSRQVEYAMNEPGVLYEIVVNPSKIDFLGNFKRDDRKVEMVVNGQSVEIPCYFGQVADKTAQVLTELFSQK